MQPLANRETHTTNIGYLAFEALSNSQEVSVLGVISKGLFLRSTSRWLIFLSFEKYCSPFTINLQETIDQLLSVKPKSSALIRSEALIFPQTKATIFLKQDTVYHPPGPSGKIRSFSARLDDLKYFVEATKAFKYNRGFGTLLHPLLSLPIEDTLTEQQRWTLDAISKIGQALRASHISQAIDTVDELLGFGPGLTASGDDFMIGLLLLLNRWPGIHRLGHHLQKFNKAVVEAAYQKTSTLSANLIECATFGQSDERIVNVVDCIVTGNPAPIECVSSLSSWGASSGVDTLAGIAVGLIF